MPKLLNMCSANGTKEFAILARHAFIATSILNSLAAIGVIQPQKLEHFKSSINSVATEFVEDLNKFFENEIKYELLMEKYGHLRPGTYNIESPRYDQMEKFSHLRPSKRKTPSELCIFETSDFANIEKAFKKFGLDKLSADSFIEYARNAIEMREASKFVFSKILSCVLEITAEYAVSLGLGRAEISLFSIQEIISFAEHKNLKVEKTKISEDVDQRKKIRNIEKCVTLPLLLFDAENTLVAPFFTNQPNFITNGIVSGPVKFIDEAEKNADLDGKIVLIESADPGFDWIFSYPIKGLVTKYGGVNSHMSIRCAEFQIPSAIGCGSILFDKLVSSHTIRLDCASSQVVQLT